MVGGGCVVGGGRVVGVVSGFVRGCPEVVVEVVVVDIGFDGVLVLVEFVADEFEGRPYQFCPSHPFGGSAHPTQLLLRPWPLLRA